MTKTSRLGRTTTLALLGLLAIGVLLPVASASPVAAYTAPNPSAPPQQWAYGGAWGATSSSSASGWGPSGNYSYTTSVHAFLGWNVIFTQTNTSSTSFELQEQRTIVSSVDIQACAPSCSSPKVSGNLTANGWEVDNGFANFTTAGTVYVNGTTPTAAYAIENAQSTVSGNVTGVATWQDSQVSATPGSAYLSVAASASGQVQFSPALGLVPLNPVAGSWWNSSSTYAASGSYDVACHYEYAGILGVSLAGSCGSTGSLSGTGTVNLAGADLGHYTLGGGLTHIVTLALTGGHFRFVDGALLVPASADLFGGAATNAQAGPVGAGVGTIATSNVDFEAGGSHLGFLGAKAQLTSSTAGTLPSNGAAVSPMVQSQALPSAAAPTYAAQAEPETPSQATASDTCLLGGACAASTTPASGSPIASHGMLLLVGLVAVGALALVGAVIYIARRPRQPSLLSAATPPAPSSSSTGTGHAR